MTIVRISAIIPTLNEAPGIVASIESCRSEGIDEVIVADGGSSDDTVSLAAGSGAAIVKVNPRQRARQMNVGARHATGDILVFLHADTVFEHGAVAALRHAALDPHLLGGGFRRRFRTTSRLLHASCSIGNARARHLGWYYGDQAIWVRRHVHEQLHGFPGKPIFEDFDFRRRLARLGRTALIEPGILTSARRFQKGVLRRVALDVMLTIRHVIANPRP